MVFDVMSIVFSFMFVIWWVSYSPSVLLLALLSISLFVSGGLSFFLGCKMQAFLVILTIVGGLFVLISFVILAYPGDFDNTLNMKVALLSGVVFFLLVKQGWEANMSLFPVMGGNNELEILGSCAPLSEELSLSFIFLLAYLLLSLKLVDSMMGVNKGSFFSPKERGVSE